MTHTDHLPRKPPKHRPFPAFGVNVLVALTLTLALFSWPKAGFPTAHAAPAQEEAAKRAAARQLFEEGTVFLQRDQWMKAVDRFERAQELYPSPRIAYNLASALIPLRRLVYASELLRSLVRDNAVPQAVRDAAAQREAPLNDRLASLKLEISNLADDIEVRIDNRIIQKALIGVAMPADPRTQRIEILRGQEILLTREVTLSEGQSETLDLTVPDAKPTAVTIAPPNPVPTAPMTSAPDEFVVALPGHKKQSDSDSNTWWWIAGGTAVAAAAVAALFLLKPGEASPINGSAGNFPLGGP